MFLKIIFPLTLSILSPLSLCIKLLTDFRMPLFQNISFLFRFLQYFQWRLYYKFCYSETLINKTVTSRLPGLNFVKIKSSPNGLLTCLMANRWLSCVWIDWLINRQVHKFENLKNIFYQLWSINEIYQKDFSVCLLI